TEVVNGQTTATYTYDNADQLTSDGTTSYSYDLNGNVVSAGGDSFTWDWDNQLSQATVGGDTSTYAYDGDGVRASQAVGGQVTPYTWDRAGGLPLLLDDDDTAYLHDDGLLAEIDGTGAATYHLTDGLGSVRGLSNGNGAVTGAADYDVFGNVRASSGSASIFGYTGEQHDSSTGLTYLRARMYNPSLGRFLSADTVQPNAPGTQGYNRYAYAANNPARWTDPSGHSVEDAMGQFAFVLGLIDAFVIIGDYVTTYAPLLLMLGPFGAGIGLLLAIQFLALAILLIKAISMMLQLIVDEFDHYKTAPPETQSPELSKEDLENSTENHPQTPEVECNPATWGSPRSIVYRMFTGQGLGESVLK
ncbi:MAG: RHS repeat-associated core domain-containing protein, partial [Vicinamibacterales bacterium]